MDPLNHFFFVPTLSTRFRVLYALRQHLWLFFQKDKLRLLERLSLEMPGSFLPFRQPLTNN